MHTILLTSLIFATGSLFADAASENSPAMSESRPKEAQKPFSSFTGKLNKNKVRMRTQPTLDAGIIRELSKGDMVIVTGEIDDFYSVLPPLGAKAFVFRTFVLDNTVEGNRVNVRLEPSIDSPIIAQLNTGDKINGAISSLNNKWLEIPMPSTARFYVAKEFVEKIGDAQLMSQLLKKKEDINQLLATTIQTSQSELQKPFAEIRLDDTVKNFTKIIDHSKDFPEQAAKAKELLQSLHDTYLQKKIAYLETRAGQTDPLPYTPTETVSQPKKSVTAKMSAWNDAEETAFKEWLEDHPGESQETFVQDQLATAKVLAGILEPYTKAVKNRPGDFVLVNKANHSIIAYLYSNRVNLSDYIGQEVTLKVAPRPNHNFAFPAYAVLEME
jgi:uncharacterized protein YgiM (DUF1202 family)